MSTAHGERGTPVTDGKNGGSLGSLPLLLRERIWNGSDFTGVNISLAIATWAFLVGGSTALLVGFQQGIAAMVIGNAIGLGFMILASVVASQRYGVEQYTILRPVFGLVGVGILVFTVILITEMGWSSLLAIMVGRAVTQVSNSTFNTDFGPESLMVTFFALVAIAISWWILSRGPVTIGRFNKFIAPGLIVVTVFLMIFLVLNTSWDALLTAAPLAPFEDDRLNFALAVEFNAGVGVSWYPVMGSLARLTRTPRAALWPSYGGLLGATLIAQIVGMAAALTLGDSDPTVWMLPFGGPLLGAFILLFIAFANITSTSSIVYSTVLAIRQASGNLLSRVRWAWLCAAFFVLPAILAFFPGFMYERFMVFVTLSGAFLAPMCGAIIADYFVLRRQRVELEELYRHRSDSAYHFSGGINWAGLGAVAAGAFFYLVIYNPVTLTTLPVFSYITASLPSAIVGAVVYYVLARVLYVRRGIGGYAPAAAKVEERA
ncbi:cytosine permease [Arthrobacter sp. MSA 4-2]|uniref:purine-cytosine permease family protein n=1 Tax=Arthrobacter sp. MSA 4-2 TaxID=2794349 RepID=UPI0018E71E17|nr:cytosine permease [Arthrobacter sp. MSA 4-2]MBJ2119511.1 cytosine permease [Arthrobacter sp. MSA 4-2]